MQFPMRDDLIGNAFQRTLHGGVISAVLDAVGGLTVLASLVERMAGMSEEKATAMFSRKGHQTSDTPHRLLLMALNEHIC